MNRLTLSSLLLVVLVSGCRTTPASDAHPDGTPSLEVQAAPVRLANVPNTLVLVGSLNAQEHVVVSPEVGGTVAEVAVDFGDAVERGAVLLRLDDTEAVLRAAASRAALAQAEAVLEQAQSAYQRAVGLLKQQIFSKEAFDGTTRELRVAEANRDAATKQLALAEKHVTDSTLRSPVAGFVAARHATVGQYVGAYTPAMELVVVDPLKLRVDVPERFVGAVRSGLPVNVEVEAFPGERFAGVVTRVGAALDPATRTQPIESAIANPDARLKPGQFARVVLDLGAREALLVPRAAIDTFAGTHRAFVVHQDGRVESRTITPGDDLGQEVVVLDGLAGGETVAVSHLERLADGVRVSAIASPPS
jgi:membrane fusion protein (multidrug efflux system)